MWGYCSLGKNKVHNGTTQQSLLVAGRNCSVVPCTLFLASEQHSYILYSEAESVSGESETYHFDFQERASLKMQIFTNVLWYE